MWSDRGFGPLQYLSCRRRLLMLLCAMVAIFAAVIHLYALPLAPVGYGALLSLVLLLVAGAADYWQWRSKCQRLREARSSVLHSLSGLPGADSPVEAQYHALLHQLKAGQRLAETQAEAQATDMIDYYTLWAHQIKVPLSAMDLLIQSGSPTGQALSAELFRIEQYVDMALQYTRLESGSDYTLGPVALDAVIRRAVRKYARLFILSGVGLDYQGTETTAITDGKWLGFVLEQLLSNAVKYTPGGRVSITAESGRLTVCDNGCGIAAEDMPRIFDRGYTGATGRHEGRATGLGLYLSRRVLHRLGHTIAIDSAPGRGTGVTITFPDEGLRPLD